jgi:hypothetical protein
LTELIARLKPSDPLTNPIVPDHLINAYEITSDDADIKSWDDLLNFTVYVDTEIYSPKEPSEAIADPEVTPETVMVIAPQEAIAPRSHRCVTWESIATKLLGTWSSLVKIR